MNAEEVMTVFIEYKQRQRRQQEIKRRRMPVCVYQQEQDNLNISYNIT